MASLASCLKKAGLGIDQKDRDRLQEARLSGMSDAEAVESAIRQLEEMFAEADAQYRAQLRDMLRAGEIPDNRVLKKKLAELEGLRVSAIQPIDLKRGQEDVEAELVNLAREITDQELGDRETFDALLEMYQAQPNLNVRSSSSIEGQAYSTPAPLAFLASRMAAHRGSTAADADLVYEPTAGNGMLMINTRPGAGIVNEMDPARADALERQGWETVTRQDATTFEPNDEADVVLANPPFGKLRSDDRTIKTVKVDGFNIREIDHLIAAQALGTLRSDNKGRATLIIGANHRKEGEVRGNDRIFFNWLYSRYNVADHFEVHGDLYRRQGAGWTVAVIVIDGKHPEPVEAFSPKNGQIERLTDWDSIYERASGNFVEESVWRADVAAGSRAKRRGSVRATPAPAEGESDVEGAADSVDAAQSQEPGRTEQRPDERSGDAAERADTDSGRSGRPDDDQRADDGDTRATDDADAKPEAPAGKSGRSDAEGSERSVDPKPVAQGSSFQAGYKARSKGFNEDILTPRNMAEPTDRALTRLEEAVGPIDKYVKEKLGYKSIKEMHKAFFGLQVDAVAMGIYQLENRSRGLIIADQTGVGKGRQAAAMIRYALRNNMQPVFVTVTPNLFTDMYGDLADIGTDDARPFILNADEGIVDGKGKKQFKLKPAERKAVIAETTETGELPDSADMLFMTYSQINKENPQRAMVRAIERPLFILDEAHNASGQQETISKGVRKLTTAGFISEVIDGQAVVYLSATYAKRPDSMPVFYRTDIIDAVDSVDQLVEAVQQGGVPLQGVVASMLAESGQLVRRERSFEGISVDVVIDKQNSRNHRALADEVTKGLRAIVEADKLFSATVVEDAKAEAEGRGERARAAGNQVKTTIDHNNFNSVAHNYVRQMLLAIKADQAAEIAIETHKSGTKPVIALETTMGSFIDEFAVENGINPGDAFFGNFKDVLLRALERTRRISVKDGKGDPKVIQFTLEELPPAVRNYYEAAEQTIEALALDEVPLSPIDRMKHIMQKAGMTVEEITGRSAMLDYSTEVPTLARRSDKEVKNRRPLIDGFNNGKLDALILNVAGSTGLSIHSSERFTDQKPRKMFVAQPMGDVNVLVQMLGRINRTGQVVLPEYELMGTDLPTEKRPLAVAAAKLASLNANTSANAKSDISVEAADILNKYGDRVAADWIRENREIASGQLGLSIAGEEGSDSAPPGLALKLTGRMALLPVDLQEEIYAEIEASYKELMTYLDATGRNELVTSVIDLDAKSIESRVAYEGKDPESIFGKDVVVHKIDAKYQGKPPTPREVIDEWKAAQENPSAADILRKKASKDTVEAQLEAKGIEAQQQLDAIKAEIEEKPTPVQASQMRRAQRMIDSSARAVENYRTARGQTERLLSSIDIGSTVYLDLGEEHAAGIVTEIKDTSKRGRGNPFALSKTRVKFVVASGIRQIEIPGSQLVGENTALLSFNDPAATTEERINRDFDKSDLGDRREIRYVATDNLIAGSAELRGRIVNFTVNGGGTRQGILLPKTFGSEEFDALGVDGEFVARDPDAIVKFLRDTGTWIGSRGGAVKIEWAGNDWEVSVPKSGKSAEGNKVKFSPAVRELAGDLAGSGKRMSARVSDAQLPELVRAVMADAVLYLNEAKRAAYVAAGGAEAREATPLTEGGTGDQRLSAESEAEKPEFSLAPATAGGMKVPAIQRIAKRMTKDLTDPPKIVVVPTQADLPASILSHLASPDDPVRGARYQGVVYIVAEHAESRQKVAEVIRHEVLGHVLVERMPTFNALVKGVQQAEGRDATIDTWFAYVDRVYGQLDPQMRVREVIAHMAQGEAQHPWIDFMAASIRRLARRLGLVDGAMSAAEVRRFIATAARSSLYAPIEQGVPAFQRVPSEPEDGPVSQPVDGFDYTPPLSVSRSREAVRLFVDKFEPLRNVQDEIAKTGKWIRPAHDAHLAQRLFHGKVENDISRFETDFVEPLAKMMAKAGLTIEEVGMFAYARHAPERNAQIAQINPEMPEAGSGLSDENAADIFEKANREGKLDALNEAMTYVDAMIDHARQTMQDAGLESEGTIAGWRGLSEEFNEDGEASPLIAYNYYVPLQGFAIPRTDITNGPRLGQGMAIRGRESLNALGRRSLAENPLINTIVQAERTIVRARKAEVGVSLLRLASDNPNPKLWKVWNPGQMPTKRRLNSKTNEVEYVVDRGAFQGDEYFPVKVNGQQYFVQIKDQRLAEAMKNLDVTQLNALLAASAKVTRMLSQLNTSLNPAFIPYNFTRDVQTAVAHVLMDQKDKNSPIYGKRLAWKVARDSFKAMRGIYVGFDKEFEAGPEANEWANAWQEFVEEGAKVGHFGQIDMKHQFTKLEKLVAAEQPGPAGMSRRVVRQTADYIDKVNTAVENAVRLALYVHARREGVDRRSAAGMAKNLTVDFNQRGAWGAGLNALYMFANAGIQGNTAIIRRLIARGAMAGMGVAVSIATVSGIMSALARAMSDDDDDGRPRYEDIPDYIKDKNFIIWNPWDSSGKGYISIPMPYGYNALAAFGVGVENMIAGEKSPMEAGLFISGAFISAFNPLGTESSETLLGAASKTVVPTIGRPFVHVLANENYFGGPLMPDYSWDTRPESEKHWRSNPAAYQEVAAYMNRVTGGNEYVSGSMDVSPEVLQEFFEYYTGGLGRTIERAVVMAGDAMDGKVEPNQIPIARRVYRETTDQEDQGEYYELRDRLDQIKAARKGLKGDELKKFIKDHRAEVRLLGPFEAAEKRLKSIRNTRKRTVDEAEVERLRASEALIMDRFLIHARAALR